MAAKRSFYGRRRNAPIAVVWNSVVTVPPEVFRETGNGIPPSPVAVAAGFSVRK